MESQHLQCCFQDEAVAYQVIMPMIRLYLGMLPIKDIGMIEVAISEAVSNAIRACGDRNVHLQMYVHPPQGFVVRIRDHGKGFDVDHAMKKLNEWDQGIPDDSLYEESGRGLWVIHQVFDEVQYMRAGSELLLIKSL